MSDEHRQEIVDAMISMKDQHADFEDLIARWITPEYEPMSDDEADAVDEHEQDKIYETSSD